MRLIDADELIKDRVSNDPVVIAAKCAPTTYDVDKVVKELEENAKYFREEADELAQVGNWGTAADLEGRAKTYRDAVEIVKSGGIE